MAGQPVTPYNPMPIYIRDEDHNPRHTGRRVTAEYHDQYIDQLDSQDLSSNCETILVRARKRPPTPTSMDAARAAANEAVWFKIHAEFLPDPKFRLSKYDDTLKASSRMHKLSGQTVGSEGHVQATRRRTLQEELASALNDVNIKNEDPSEASQPLHDTGEEPIPMSHNSTRNPEEQKKVATSPILKSGHIYPARPSSPLHPSLTDPAQSSIQPTTQTYKCPGCSSLLHIDGAGTCTIQAPPPPSPPAKEKKHKSLRRVTIRFSLPTPKPACSSDPNNHVWMPMSAVTAQMGVQQLRDSALAKSDGVIAEHGRQPADAERRYFATPSSEPEKEDGRDVQRRGVIFRRSQVNFEEPKITRRWR